MEISLEDDGILFGLLFYCLCPLYLAIQSFLCLVQYTELMQFAKSAVKTNE